jgi:hypothetical protein
VNLKPALWHKLFGTSQVQNPFHTTNSEKSYYQQNPDIQKSFCWTLCIIQVCFYLEADSLFCSVYGLASHDFGPRFRLAQPRELWSKTETGLTLHTSSESSIYPPYGHVKTVLKKKQPKDE